MSIPARLHFCWIGGTLPWAYVFAILSAAERSGLPEIVLHHTDPLPDTAGLGALRNAPGVRLARVDPAECLGEVGRELGVGDGLRTLYERLDATVMRADVLRAALVHRHGGVYLDLDTVTVATLRPLLDTAQFVGTEFIVWPDAARRARSPLVLGRHLALDLARKLCRRLPGGWRLFQAIERFYVRQVNNAAFGAEAGAGLLAAYLRAMLDVPLSRRHGSTAFGPKLLADVIDRERPRDLTIEPPEVFCPLAPEVSEHWFRTRAHASLHGVMSPPTRVVHWFASVRTRPLVALITPDYVRAHRGDQFYSALVHACLPNFFRSA